MTSDRYVLTQAIREAVKAHEFLVLAAAEDFLAGRRSGAGRMRMRETLPIERLCRPPPLDLLRRRALNAGGR
jgi:hypothetical protein